jgi:hypothetical protein
LQRWGINIVGLLTAAQGNYKYAVVVVEYFTKWIEVKPLVTITAVGLKKFFWQNIICRFGVIRKIIINNAKQFDCNIFKELCHQMGVKTVFASVYHPQSNSAVEKSRRTHIHSSEENIEGSAKGQMGIGTAKGSMEPQHLHLQSHQIHPIHVVVR